MLYAIIGTETPNRGANRHPTRSRHLERVQAPAQLGRPALAGPFPATDADSLRPAALPNFEPARAGRSAAGRRDAPRLRRVQP